MKKLGWIALGLLLATGTTATAAERTFVLATAGDVDAAFAETVRAALEKSSGAAIRLAAPVPTEPGQSLEAIGRAAAAALGEGDHSVVVLARAGADQPQGVCLPHVRFGAINLSRLEEGADAARLERRATQEGLRVMSLLLDMSSCPFPLCVLVGYDKTEDLDRMSGNFCPPCLDRFTRTARDAGLRLIDPFVAEAAAPAEETAPAEEAAPAPEAPPAPEPAPAVE